MRITGKVLILALAVGVIGFGLFVGAGVRKSEAASSKQREAVVLRSISICTDGACTAAVDVVYSVCSSSGAPAITNGMSSAEAIADLVSAGFKIEHAQSVGTPGGVTFGNSDDSISYCYTLVR